MKLRMLALGLLLSGFAIAQVPNPTSQPPAEQNPNGYAQGTTTTSTGETVPLFRVQVVSRTLEAVNYRHLGGETKVDMIGTTLMPEAKGDAHVDARHGRVVIGAKFDKLGPASQFGPEYLTYVLWAITPEGRAQNLGELPIKGDHAQLDVTTDLQTFGLMVTAEPYFSVTQPSDAVVMENKILPDTKGQVEEVTAKYELLPRGQYEKVEGNGPLPPLIDYDHERHKVPLGLLEARNALRLAHGADADKYAADSLAKAQAALDRAEDYYNRKQWKPVETAAREAAQDAEDARVIAIRRHEQESIAEARARDRQRAEEARARADAAEAQQQREAQQRAQAEQDRQAAEQARLQAEQAQQQAEQARQAALTAQQQAETQRQAAEQQAQQAQLQAQQAEQQKEELRQRLQQQLNSILQTQDSARGLIVNMSDVLFDTNKYTLKPGAREKLAKVSGILLAYPGLKVQVEGYTDSTGRPEYNQHLSEERAMTVRDYLVAQGINMNSVTSQGFGENDPVASNATASGRQQNRRVQMVVNGEPIGTVASAEGAPTNGTAGSSDQYQNPQGQAQPAVSQPYQPQTQPTPATQAPQPTVPH
jgi:outer membrane protein OmpA-like peptidoglycan-associated protein